MYAVCVTFKIKDGAMDQFMPLMHANAQLSLQTEPGCRQFDVLTDTSKPAQVFLYELYTDRAAFDAHLASTHFKTFDAAITQMISAKDVQTWETVTQ